MNNHKFELDPRQYGLPTIEKFKEYRIWDSHYHGYLTGGDPISYNDKMLKYVHRMGLERVISVDIGGTLSRHWSPSPTMIRNGSFWKKTAITSLESLRSIRAFRRKVYRKWWTGLKTDPALVLNT